MCMRVCVCVHACGHENAFKILRQILSPFFFPCDKIRPFGSSSEFTNGDLGVRAFTTSSLVPHTHLQESFRKLESWPCDDNRVKEEVPNCQIDACLAFFSPLYLWARNENEYPGSRRLTVSSDMSNV